MDKETVLVGNGGNDRSIDPVPLPFATQSDINSITKADIDGEDYKAMIKCFLMKGKGRRPAVQSYNVATHRLLLQLYFVKEEAKNQTSFAQLMIWLKTLIPDKCYKEGAVYRKIKTLLSTYPTLAPDMRLPYLNEEFDPDALDPALTSLGLTRLHLTDQVPFDMPPQQVTNEVIVELEHYRAKVKQTHSFVTKWLKRLCFGCIDFSYFQLKSKVDIIMKTYVRLLKNKNVENKDNFLKDPFLSSTTSTTITTTTKFKCSTCKENEKKISSLNITIKSSDNSLKALEAINKTLISESKSNKDIISELQEEKTNLLSSIDTLNSELLKIKYELKQLSVELLKERVEKEQCIFNLKTVKSSTLYKDNFKRKRELEETLVVKDILLNDIKVKDENSSQLKNEIGSLKKKVKLEQSLKSKYRDSYKKQKLMNTDLSKMLAFDDHNNKLDVKEHSRSHRFSDNVRQTYYALQANVSASNCSKVVSTVARCLFNSDLTENDLPSQSTALNFVNEANVIAKEHVVDEIKNNSHFTYACDGTSRDKVHFVEKHIYLSNGKTMSLGFSEIASDDSDTLLERCVSSFDELCTLHCIDNVEDENLLMKEMIRKLKCLMTDRAAVCKAFDAKMADYKTNLLRGEDASTLFLFCNAHFLLALSKATEDTLLTVEEDMGKLGRDVSSKFFGWVKKEAAAVRLIRMVASILGPRCDERNGCRQEWLAFCSTRGIKSSFTSFRSNRFNNLFQNATALLRHRNDIKEFLNDYVSHSNLKFESILLDLDDDRIINLISVLSFFHIMFTEPYWQLMNSDQSYGDFPFYVKKMKHVLSEWSLNDIDVLNSTSAFHDFPVKTVDSIVIFEFCKSHSFDDVLFNDCLKCIANKFLCALERQLFDFLDNGVFGGKLDDEVNCILKSCPLTNLTGERLFGDLDYCINKRRNATLHLRSTHNMWKHNHTAKWLGKQKIAMAKKLINKAVKFGPEWRKRHEHEKRAVKSQIKARIELNKERKLAKDNKLKERKVLAMNAIIDQGGKIVSSKEDIDLIFSGPKAVKRLKDQIRYRRLCLGENISMTGNKKLLYEHLLAHIMSTDRN